jgi:hypothetical protein
MARDFTKNTSNHLSLGLGSLGSLINGAAKISAHVWVNFDTIETSNNTNDRVLEVLINSNATGFTIASNAPDSITPVLRAGARSVSGDSFQTRLGTTPLTTGAWLSLGAVADFSGDTLTPYYQGAAENGGAATFGNSSYTQGVPTEADTIGGHFSPPPETNVQVDGRVAEIALWNDDIGAAGFAALASGVSALSVRRDALVFYMRLLGDASPETADVSSVTGTITGSIPQAAHPNIFILAGPSLFRGRGFSFFDDEEVNRFEFWPAISEGAVNLAVQNAAHAHTADNAVLTQTHELVVQSATHDHVADNVAVTQVHSLVAQDAAHAHIAENAAVVQTHILIVDGSTHSHIAENTALAQVHQLSVQDAAHAHSADNVALSQTHDLAVDSASHAHVAESVLLVQVHALAVQPAGHSHAAENAVLTQTHMLGVQDAIHDHAADNVVIDQAVVLTVQDAVHEHTATSPAITQTHELVADNASHTHTADSPPLVQVHALAVDDAVHAHSVENVAITQIHTLTVQGTAHGHLADNAVLGQGVQLVVANAVHSHTAENVALTQVHLLVIASVVHGHTAGNVVLGSEQIITPPSRTFVVDFGNRTATIERSNRVFVVEDEEVVV